MYRPINRLIYLKAIHYQRPSIYYSIITRVIAYKLKLLYWTRKIIQYHKNRWSHHNLPVASQQTYQSHQPALRPSLWALITVLRIRGLILGTQYCSVTVKLKVHRFCHFFQIAEATLFSWRCKPPMISIILWNLFKNRFLCSSK